MEDNKLKKRKRILTTLPVKQIQKIKEMAYIERKKMNEIIEEAIDLLIEKYNAEEK